MRRACSYCIIPRTRGAGRSRPLGDVLRRRSPRRRVRVTSEIAITGVHLGSYGRDLGDGTTLADALFAALAEWPDDVLFRISSLEPMDCTPEIVELVARVAAARAAFSSAAAAWVATPCLRAMRRPYTVGVLPRPRRRHSRAAAARVDRHGHHRRLSRRDRRAFRRDARYCVESLPLTHLHVFPYSDRPGTEATRLLGEGRRQRRFARARATIREHRVSGRPTRSGERRWAVRCGR